MTGAAVPQRYSEKEFQNIHGFSVERASLRYQKMHWHDFYEIELVEMGTALHILNGTESKLCPGSLAFLSPSDFHEIYAEGEEPLRLITVHFNELFVSGGLLAQLDRLEGRIFSLPEDLFGQVSEECLRLLTEFPAGDGLREIALRNSVDRICLLLLRAFGRQMEENLRGAGMQPALAYVDRHFREPVTLRDAANTCHFSPSYFSEAFHKAVGEPFQSYLVKKRLGWAKRLLAATDMSVSQIGYEAGFNSHTHFSRSFKKVYGCTPSQMRMLDAEKRHRNAEDM